MIWIALIALPTITLFATLNLALASRIRLAERFDEGDSSQSIDGILRTRQHYVLATALVRSTATLVLTVIVLYEVGAIGSQANFWRLINGLALVLAFVFLWAGWEFTRFAWNRVSELADLPLWMIHVAWPVAGLSWLLFQGERMVGAALVLAGKAAPKAEEKHLEAAS